ncbi:MAG: hypothetical protein O3C27_10660 [Actinomycetota bacterium]|nr:hypothetical protein [Actinomycetota bacterium]
MSDDDDDIEMADEELEDLGLDGDVGLDGHDALDDIGLEDVVDPGLDLDDELAGLEEQFDVVVVVEEGAEPRVRVRRDDDDDDDDDEETDPDDVEADLEEILRDRMAASDDDDDDDDEPDGEEGNPSVPAKRGDEFLCGLCFLVVSRAQLNTPCPMGDGIELHRPAG